MQVQKVENNNYNTNFQALKINSPELWDGKILQEFVHNTEVQKFVKYWHEQGIDIMANEQHKLGIALWEDSKKPDRFLVGIHYRTDGLKNFKATEAIAKIKQEAKEKIESSPLIIEAQEFVLKFNKALEEIKK